MENRYYIVDYGKDMIEVTQPVIERLKKTDGCHVVTYLTDLDNAMMVTETTEDDFLEHFKSVINEN